MKFLLGCNIKMSLIGEGENEPLLEGQNLLGWGSLQGGFFLVKK